MKTYKIFEKDGQRVAVKQGWSWPAFFFQWIWAFTKKLMLPGSVGLVTNIAFALFPVTSIMRPYFLITGIIFGIKGNKWWETYLLKNGFLESGTVQAKNPVEAASRKSVAVLFDQDGVSSGQQVSKKNTLKGTILDFSIQTSEGIISGDDNNRYKFAGSEWKATDAPARGQRVDFNITDGRAIEVFRNSK